MAEQDRPTDDVYSNEWYRKQFQSLAYHWQRSLAEEAELQQQVRMLRKELDQLSKDRKADMAKIGELQDRIENAAKIVTELRKQSKQGAMA